MTSDESTGSSNSPKKPTTKRWWQFSLRTMMIVMLVCACGFGTWGYYYRQTQLRERAEKICNKLDVILYWDQEDPHLAHVDFWNVPISLDEKAILKQEDRILIFNTLQSLQAVSISNLPDAIPISDLSQLRNLVYLKVSKDHTITDSDLKLLAEFPKLRYLEMHHANPTMVDQLKAKRPELIVVNQTPPERIFGYEEGEVHCYDADATKKIWSRSVLNDTDSSLDLRERIQQAEGLFVKPHEDYIFTFPQQVVVAMYRMMHVFSLDGEPLWNHRWKEDYEVIESQDCLSLFELSESIKEDNESSRQVFVQPHILGKLHCFNPATGKPLLSSKQQLGELKWDKVYQLGKLIVYSGTDPRTVNFKKYGAVNNEEKPLTYLFDLQGNIIDQQVERVIATIFDSQQGFLLSNTRLAKYSPSGKLLWSVPQKRSEHEYAVMKILPNHNLICVTFNHLQKVQVQCFNTQDGTRKWFDNLTALDAPNIEFGEYQVVIELDMRENVAIACLDSSTCVSKYNPTTGEQFWNWSD